MDYKSYIKNLNEGAPEPTTWVDSEGDTINIGDELEVTRKHGKTEYVMVDNEDMSAGLKVLRKDRLGRYMTNSSETFYLNKKYYEDGKFELLVMEK